MRKEILSIETLSEITPDHNEIALLDQEKDQGHRIVVYNDDVNTFDHVINCFINYLGHDPHQAEQCAWIIHNNGKASVKTGMLEELIPLRDMLCEEMISAEVEAS